MAKKDKWGEENIKAGDNQKFLAHAMKIARWSMIDFDDDNAVIDRLDAYFNLCMEDDIKPTVSGMANALKISRFTLYDWKSGKRRTKTDNRSEIIAQYYNILEELYEDYMMNGKVNPVSGIFMGKNHFGYKDKREVEVKPKDKFQEGLNAKEVRDKYLESAGVYLPDNKENDKADKSENT